MDARKEGGGDFWDPEVLSPDSHKRYGCIMGQRNSWNPFPDSPINDKGLWWAYRDPRSHFTYPINVMGLWWANRNPWNPFPDFPIKRYGSMMGQQGSQKSFPRLPNKCHGFMVGLQESQKSFPNPHKCNGVYIWWAYRDPRSPQKVHTWLHHGFKSTFMTSRRP